MCVAWLPSQAGVGVTRTMEKKNQPHRLEKRKFQARPCLSNSKAEHGESSLKSQKSEGWDVRIQSSRPWEVGSVE